MEGGRGEGKESAIEGAVGQLLFCCVLCEARKGEVTAHPNWHPCLAICGLKSEWIVERQWAGMGGVATNNSVLGVGECAILP